MEKNEIEREVEKTLNRLNSIQRMQAPPFFPEKIMDKLKERRRIESLSPAFVFRFGVACVIFISINIFTYSYLGKAEKMYNKTVLEEFASGCFTNDVFNY